MAHSKIDLDALRSFRARLRDIRADIAREQKGLGKTVEDASNFWKDNDYQTFVARHSAADLDIRTFLRQCDDQLAWIEKKEQLGRRAVDFPF